MSKGTIKKVAGPLVIAEGMRDANMYDVVRVSNQRLIGEIIEMHGDEASVQVYEETSGLGPGEPVESTDAPLSVELGPGLITSIYDGIQRPLDDIMKVSGTNLKRGVEVPSLKRDRKWNFVPTVQAGEDVEAGDIIGTVQETIVVNHKIMVPYGIKGKVKEIKSGEFTVEDVVAVIETEAGNKELTMMQKWPVRRGRPYVKKLPPEMPLVTGQPKVVEAAPAGTRQENVTVVSGDTQLKRFSVVCGAFGVKANAEGVKQRLTGDGYNALVVFNAERNLYRVVVSTFEDRAAAEQSRDAFKARYPQNADFQKAWLLYNVD